MTQFRRFRSGASTRPHRLSYKILPFPRLLKSRTDEQEQGNRRYVPYDIVRELFQVPATVPLENMTKWIPFLVTKRISTHVEAGSFNQGFLMLLNNVTAVWVLFVGATDGFIVLLTGTLVVASSVRRTNVVMRNWKGTSRDYNLIHLFKLMS